MWTETEEVLLTAVLDVLIPPSDDARVIGAGQLGIARDLPVAVPGADQDEQAIRRILERLASTEPAFTDADSPSRKALVKTIENEAPNEFAALVRQSYMAYYSRPDTRALFGLSRQPVHPGGYDVTRESEDHMDDLTAPVRARGACFRQA